MNDIEDRFEWIILEDDKVDEEEFVNKEGIYSIVCIDIGLVNLGICAFTIDPVTYEWKKMIGYDLMNITTFPHPEGICKKTCCLSHTKTFADWMSHIFEFYKPIFEGCTKILIERQPPQGFVVIEQLLYSKYRDKTELIHPNSMHSFFNISNYDYEKRKEEVEKIFLEYVREDLKEEFLQLERRHDIADALCIGLYWINNKQNEYKLLETQKRLENLNIKYKDKISYEFEEGMDLTEYLHQFNYSCK